MTEKQRERKRKGTDADIETQLLEANKKRLLKQQDWIGVAPSRPVDLQFLSIKEKSRIGKRRKSDGKSKAVTRRRSPTTFPRRAGQGELERRGDTFMRALPVVTAAANIRVRIGSDDLTTAASTQPKNYARSQTNSDSMLFDEEGVDAARQMESEAPQSVTPSGHALAANPRSNVNQPAKSDSDFSLQHGQSAHRGLTEGPDVHANERIRYVAAEANTLDQSVQQSEATDPSYRLTHHVGGIERPLKLVFDRRSPSRVGHTASPTGQIGKAQRVHATFNAKETETGHASRNVGEAHQSVIRRPPNAPAIVDDEPWRTYLDIGTSSSGQVRVNDETGTSVPQPHVSARNTRADRTSCPQHTAQGNLTHVNLSTVSASLLAPKRRSDRLPDARPLLRTAAIKEVDDNEQVWRCFVGLGSDPQSAIDTIHTHNETSEDSMSRATKGYASTRPPLSNAVSLTPFPSTPFRSLSGQASRISDDMQYAPHSGSRSITSAAPSYAAWGRIGSPNEDVQNEGQGEETPARSHFGEQSTHASSQNHASHASEMFSDTRTSRGDLDRRGRVWDDVSRRAQASGSVVLQRGRGSSIWDIPDSDEAGIDLVNPDRLT
ncbi:hypothetical protein BU25DRAFT_37002 [Macroventuria anomochaeta]|uniref:Uncharacterized protein n=1 Tax=Macroventuria anomochaeta TaxID=301207 RepID=A0ACB6S5L3_9PLEO|nr:uncharacterized protein BU25DRAFT_37002 [Macroventuria anomochaeta]KAF2628494.1 hypothetical protein BU25DRAFT_37002 [Macroventuria anomochaeta]